MNQMTEDRTVPPPGTLYNMSNLGYVGMTEGSIPITPRVDTKVEVLRCLWAWYDVWIKPMSNPSRTNEPMNTSPSYPDTNPVRMSPPPSPGHMMLHDPVTGRGAYFDYRNPDPTAITLGMLAQGLSSIIRWRGFTTRPIPVTEHSMRVGRFAAELANEQDRSAARLWGLLHDAHELLTPWGDCPSPWKTKEMKAVQGRMDPFVWENVVGRELPQFADFGKVVSPSVLHAVELADLAALYYEAMLWQPHADPRVSERARGLIAEVGERLLPLIGTHPREDEDWYTEVVDAIECLSIPF
jgi:5'-deoxynucleotidase YfbR-like HD superfamily hydrolase